MKIAFIIIISSFLFLSILSFILYKTTAMNIFLILFITFITIFYHLFMRLVVGGCVNAFKREKTDYNKRWYRTSKTEIAFYKKIKVKMWKNLILSFDPSSFDLSIKKIDEVVDEMCKAEIIHTIIFFLSYVPIFASIFVGCPLIFIITSFIASLFDLSLVMVQRYNRNRIIHSVTFYKKGGVEY